MPTPPLSRTPPVQTLPDPAARLRALARLLDSAVRVPGTNVRVGLDAALGFLPGIGDLAGAAVSAYVLLVAARLGASPAVLGRMLVNTGIDALFGTVPFLGDLFDIGWRANSRNVALLERHLADPAGTRRASRGVVALALVGLLLIAVVGIALSVLVVRALVGLVR